MKTKSITPELGVKTETVNKKMLLKKWQKLAVLFLALISLLSVVFFTFYIQHKFNKFDQIAIENSAAAAQNSQDDIPSNYIRRQLDGVYVEPEQADNFPRAVMIDNDPRARPQGGLAAANLVYEARAESNITRYLAVFSELSDIEKIGPVRSARPYFLDWSQGIGALYVHVGGSQQALKKIQTERILDIDEYYNENFFWRADDKSAPHNVYTSAELMNEYLQLLSVDKPRYSSWLYKDDLEFDSRSEAQQIEIDYGVFNFNVVWVYNKESNSYTRQQAGIIYKDLDEKTVEAKNIIIMSVESEVIDSELRREMATIGNGRAVYCFDGACHDGVWRKANSKEREKIYDINNVEVKFNAGTTWIQVVQDDVSVVIN
ncbi:MAG: DUF3048 domain-containing protein [bacterium]|nr:DUF3048 domain-containing protein [bacterium]